MSSALESRPRLHPEVKIVRREVRGEVHYVVREPTERKYYQLDEAVVTLMRLMDGVRTPRQIADAAERELGATVSDGQVADLSQKLKRMGIVERSSAEQHLMLQERLRQERNLRSRRRTQGSILRLRIPFGDPDETFGRLQRSLRWMWTPGFVLASAGIFLLYILIVVARWPEVVGGTIDLYTLSGIGPSDLVLLIGITAVISVIHELGHGLTTKALGGEVHEWGAMLLYFSPAMYCATDDAWTFEKKSHRLWTTFAGPWIQLVAATIAGVVWALTEPGTLINWAAFLAFLIGGAASIFSNMNPLLPLDGYFALADWLEIPRLRGGAFGYWGWLIRRRVLGLPVQEPRCTPRERRIFLAYGALAFLYSTFALGVALLWLSTIGRRIVGPWVWVLIAFMIGRLLAGHTGRARSLSRVLRTRWRDGFSGGSGAALLGIVAAGLFATPFLLPWTYRASGEFAIEASPPTPVRAAVPGIIDRVLVSEGEFVEAGAPLAVLWNPDLESAYIERRAENRRLDLRRARAGAERDRTEASIAATTAQKLYEDLEILGRRRERLVIRAPNAGTVLGERLAERTGERLQEGDVLTSIATPVGRLARIRIPLKNAGELAIGQPAGLRLSTRPDLEFRSTVTSIAPSADGGTVEVIVPLPSAEWQPQPGMTGVARIQTRTVTFAHAIARAWRQTIRIDLWL